MKIVQKSSNFSSDTCSKLESVCIIPCGIKYSSEKSETSEGASRSYNVFSEKELSELQEEVG